MQIISNTDDQFRGLAFDWVTGNVYIATWGGFVLACDGTLERNLKCVTILSGQGKLVGIALDPGQG